MSREDVVAVALRLFAVYLLLIVLRTSIPALTASEGDPSALPPVLWLALLVVPMLGLALLFWVFPLSVAARLLPVMREPRPPVRAEAAEVEGIALTLLGLWLCAAALSDAVYWVIVHLSLSRSEMWVGYEVSSETFASMVTTGFELVLGLWLMLGSRGWQQALRRWRYAGSPASAVSVERAIDEPGDPGRH
jgi:Ca2+/Na+ antiporter